jgi:hypothetical protein
VALIWLESWPLFALCELPRASTLLPRLGYMQAAGQALRSKQWEVALVPRHAIGIGHIALSIAWVAMRATYRGVNRLGAAGPGLCSMLGSALQGR